METLVQHSAAGTSGGGDDGMLANTSGGMTAQGMETINPDDLGEDEVGPLPDNGQTKGGHTKMESQSVELGDGNITGTGP